MLHAGLDYLASPTGAIYDAQHLAAKAFGAEQSWFLVNGTSVGIHAAVLATCAPSKCIVLARNCHQSAIAATMFAGRLSSLHGHVLANGDVDAACLESAWSHVKMLLQACMSQCMLLVSVIQ